MDISPKFPLPLAGFSHRNGSFEGISRPLFLRVLFFQLEGNKQSILISADLIWWDTNRANKVRNEIAEIWEMDGAAVILHATHSHSGPQTSDQFILSLGTFDPSYVQFIEERLMLAIEQAYENMEIVTMDRGTGECRIGINRRKIVDGQVVMSPNYDGPIDPEINVIRFRTENRMIKAIITHYTCHPTTTGDNYLSSEYPGVAMEYLEKHYGGILVALFLQGSCGDVRPALIKDEAFYRGTDHEVQELGMILAEEVLSVMRAPMNRLEASFDTKKIEVPLSFRYLPSLDELKGNSRQSGIMGEWSSLLLNQPKRIQAKIPLEITYLELSNNLAFLAMNGEVVVEYGLWIKSISGGKILPLPYSNGMVGYIPTAKQTEEGGYEAEESTVYFGLPAPFSKRIEKDIKLSIRNLIGEEFPNERSY